MPKHSKKLKNLHKGCGTIPSAFLYLLCLLVFTLYSNVHFGQDTATIKKPLVDNERTAAISFNSNGWSVAYRYGKYITGFRKQLYEVDFSNIKHPKEYKLNNPYFPNERRFVFGKMNNFFVFHFGYGRQVKMYEKTGKGGIEIRYYYLGGPVIGFIKPIYYEVINYSTLEIRTEKFNPSVIHHYSDIYGRASFFKGFSELQVVPGLYMRTAASFEYSKKTMSLNAVEVGMGLDIYPKKIEIMAMQNNAFAYFSLFVTYRFGRIIDPLAKFRNKQLKEKNTGSRLKDLGRE